jgi:hypothetical protein
MNRGFISFIILLSIAFIACKEPKSTNTYIDTKLFTFQQQGWKSKQITQVVSDINYTATEVPLQYYLLKHIGQDFNKVDSIYNVNSKERIIEIEFQHSSKKDLLLQEFTQKNYEESVKYMAFKIANDFTVVTSSNDTITCSGAHFERNYKVAPFKRALLYFNNINQNDNIKLIYQDQLFGNGTIKFNFTETPLKL